MTSFPRVQLGELVNDERPKRKTNDEAVWNLNLDQIEPDTGRVLERILVQQDELGPSTYPFDEGTVLYSKLRPYLNKVVVAEAAGYATTELVPLRCNTAKVFPSYLAYFLRSAEFLSFANTVVAGAKMPRMVMSEFWKYEAPLPPLPEQRRIAAILDKADALRTQRREALAHLDRLAQAIFVEMFGDPGTNPKNWLWRPLGAIADKFSDGPFGSNLKSDHYKETGVRVVRLQNIGAGSFVDKDRAYISVEHFENIKKHECIPGDVLVGTLGDPNLRACIQPEFIPLAINKADCVQIRVNQSLAHATFICALLNHPSTEVLAQALMKGQTRVRISMGSLRGLKVPIPPLDLQQEFARRIAALEVLRTEQLAGADDFAKLFAALQHRAFRGEL